MSKDLNDRIKLIKKAINKNESPQPHLYIVPKTELVNKLLDSESRNSVIDNFLSETKERYNFELNPKIDDKELNDLLNSLKGKFDSERMGLLVDGCKKSVLDSIIKPFGIAGMIFEDKVGGNVDTIHNVRNKDKKYNNGQGIYATDENKKKYEDRTKYDSNPYHKHANYINKNKEASVSKDNGTLKDAYSGKDVKRNDKIDLDHTISAKEISDDAGRVLAGLDGPDLACADSNLNITDESVNRSKKEKSVDDFSKRLEDGRKERQNRISELKDRADLSQKEEKELNKLKKLDETDVKILKQRDEEARTEYNSKVNKAYYGSKEFAANLGKTSTKEGLKMGTQQALGLMVKEFALGVFSEAEDIFSSRHSIKLNAEFLQSLKESFERISRRVMSKWKDVVIAFGSGAISGFFSNIITVIINSFFTTGKRAVKMIREGFFSLLKALKLLMSPPANMSREEAAHEATKLIAAGLIVVGGIAIEETLQKALLSVPVIGMFSDIIAPVVMGIVTGLSMAFVVYLIDKIDLFKVNASKIQQYISDQLDEMIGKDLEEYDDAYNYIASTLGI